MKKWLSKRLIMAVVSAVIIPVLVSKLGVPEETAWTIVIAILGYLGVETVRPSGTRGAFGKDGDA